MKEIMGEFIDMKNISTLIPDIKQEMLPDDEEEKKYAHIRYKERYYKAEIMKVCIDDFAMENKVVEMQPEAYQLFAFTDVQEGDPESEAHLRYYIGR